MSLKCGFDGRPPGADTRPAPLFVLQTWAGIGVVVGLCAIAASLPAELDPLGYAAHGITENVVAASRWLDENRVAVYALLLAGGVVYALLISIPFIPGLELGLALMVLAGPEGVLVVYPCTVAGLAMAFASGRRLRRANPGLGSRYENTCRALCATRMGARLTAQIVDRPTAPYLCTALLINLPGNSLVGGGGGVALLSGLSTTQSWRGFLLTVAFATAPVPVLFLTGFVSLESLT